VLLACFGVTIMQLVNVQYVKAPALEASPHNPRHATLIANNLRGDIYASDGTVLAQSVKATAGTFD
jgi:cell division protein FtsI/penicillin-binding protein 2